MSHLMQNHALGTLPQRQVRQPTRQRPAKLSSTVRTYIITQLS